MFIRLITFTAIATAWMVGCGPAAPTTNEILWDTWGVPHVYGTTHADVFYGFGWAQMESHADLILKLYGEARGRSAEYWGPAGLAQDRDLRTRNLPGLAREWYAAQSADFRQYLEAFAAGVNDYAAAHRERIVDSVEVVLPVTPEDVLAHAIRVIHFGFVGSTAALPPERRGSNTWAIGPSRSASGNAMLLANPHLPWSDFFLFYEAHLVGPGVDVYGSTLVGFPTIVIGFNDALGWSHTVNTFDGADLYRLTPAGDGYRFDGGDRAFTRRVDTLLVREADGSFRAEPLTVRESVHGPVIGERGGHPIAVRLVGLDAPGMLEQWWDMGRAANLREFETILARLDVPAFTVMYADRDGRIMHLFGGRVPKRDAGTFMEWLEVQPGDTSAKLWTDHHSYAELPRIADPSSGWLQNANDPPWWTTFPTAIDPGDFPDYMASQRMGLRPQRSARMLFEDEQITWEELETYKHSTRMELADRLLDDLLPAARELGGETARQAADLLDAWDRHANADSRGAVLFLEWIQQAFGPGFFATPWSAEAPRATPDGLADPSAAVAALEAAAARVAERYGQIDVAWGEVYRLRMGDRDLPASGGPGGAGIFRVLGFAPAPDGRMIASFGDSYVAITEFGDPLRARALLSYGNATQPHSSHVGDQLELLARQQLRPVWRERADVEAHFETRTPLSPNEGG